MQAYRIEKLEAVADAAKALCANPENAVNWSALREALGKLDAGRDPDPAAFGPNRMGVR
jgi:hypothetical protein